MSYKLGFIGLGKMGSNMVMNLLDNKIKPVAYNRSPKPVKKLAKKGAIPAYSLRELIYKLGTGKKIIWIMIPSGKAIDEIIKKLKPYLSRGDIIIDGGNSYFEDSKKRHAYLKRINLNFLDCGVSGGIEGARRGACMMVGGDKLIFKKAEYLFKKMCVRDGYGYMGKPGAGHFVKMVHNGIEYGMLSALNEGFLAMEKYQKKFGTEIKEVAKVYNHGSIIEGKLTNWLEDSMKDPFYLDNISCEVPTGETEKEMIKLEKLTNMPLLKQARLMRVHSRNKGTCGKIIAAIRNQFGGHKVNLSLKKLKKEDDKTSRKINF